MKYLDLPYFYLEHVAVGSTSTRGGTLTTQNVLLVDSAVHRSTIEGRIYIGRELASYVTKFTILVKIIN